MNDRGATERMLRIHELLASGAFPNASRVASELQVTPKTLRRDLEFMRTQCDLPIEYEPRKFGFCYSGPVKAFPGAPKLTEAEVFALLVAHKAIGQYHGTPFEQPLQLAFTKLIRLLDDKERYSLENPRRRCPSGHSLPRTPAIRCSRKWVAA